MSKLSVLVERDEFRNVVGEIEGSPIVTVQLCIVAIRSVIVRIRVFSFLPWAGVVLKPKIIKRAAQDERLAAYYVIATGSTLVLPSGGLEC